LIAESCAGRPWRNPAASPKTGGIKRKRMPTNVSTIIAYVMMTENNLEIPRRMSTLTAGSTDEAIMIAVITIITMSRRK
jgi:hypothetical protein